MSKTIEISADDFYDMWLMAVGTRPVTLAEVELLNAVEFGIARQLKERGLDAGNTVAIVNGKVVEW